MQNTTNTPFSYIYDSFLSKLTDDMYMELDEQQTHGLLEELLLSAIQKFEFPRFDITDYETSYLDNVDEYSGEDSDGNDAIAYIYNGGKFNIELTQEEINILALLMKTAWVQR